MASRDCERRLGTFRCAVVSGQLIPCLLIAFSKLCVNGEPLHSNGTAGKDIPVRPEISAHHPDTELTEGPNCTFLFPPRWNPNLGGLEPLAGCRADDWRARQRRC